MPFDRTMEFAGAAAATDDGKYDREVEDPGPAGAVNAKPSTGEVKNYLSALAGAYGLPTELVHGVARTESNFATDNKVRAKLGAGVFDPRDKAYGVLQVHESQVGKTVRDADGMPYEIGQNIKSDWKANADAGVALLARHYQLAEMEKPFTTLEERSQQAYSGYSAGNAWRDRYLQTLPYNDLPAHRDDRAFLQNHRQSAGKADDSEQKPGNAPPSQQQSASQPPPAPSSLSSASTPLPGPLQRLKKNPGDTFVQTPAALLQRPSAFAPSSGQASDATQRTAEVMSFQPPPKPSLANVARWLFSPQQGTVEQSSSLPASLQQLKDNPGNTILLKPAPAQEEQNIRSGQYFSKVDADALSLHEGMKTIAYTLDGHPNSGVTIAKGYDMGQHSPDEIARIGLSQEKAQMLQFFAAQPDGKGGYTPASGQTASNLLKQYAQDHNGQLPAITVDEAQRINAYVANTMFNDLGRRFSQASSTPFKALPGEAQTALADLAYNRGVGWLTSPTQGGNQVFVNATQGNWQQVVNDLNNTHTSDERFNERARENAKKIQEAIDAGRLPRR
jgi:hypothetical protein